MLHIFLKFSTNLRHRLLTLRKVGRRDYVDGARAGVAILRVAHLDDSVRHLTLAVAICAKLVLKTGEICHQKSELIINVW